MAKESKEKFEYVVRGTAVRYIEVKSHFAASELDAFIKLHQCDDVSVNHVFGAGQIHVDEALKSRSVRRLSIVMDSVSLAEFAGSSRIASIYLSGVLNRPFDFSAIRSLKSLNLNWQPAVAGLERMHWLQHLSLRGFRGEPASLGKLHWLQSLGLVQPNLSSLRFIAQLHGLQKLKIAYARRLKDLTDLVSIASCLEDLELDHLPQIAAIEKIVEQLAALKRLIIFSCPPMQNLEFVRALRKLEFLSFVDTNVISGDLTPCCGIAYVGFLPHRHFNCMWDAEKRKLVPKTPNSPSKHLRR